MTTPENPRLIDCADIYGCDENGDEFITGSSVHSDITLRDLFAAFAIAGQAAYEGMEGNDPKLWAGCAYEVADAMLAERAKGGAK